MILTRNEGVSPGFRKSRDNNNKRISEKNGPNEKYRFILPVSERGDLGAKRDPAADPINQEQRKAPAIIS